MDGYELFTMVRRDPATKDTPFLLLAGRDRPIALAATEAGVDMTVTGDFTLATVMSRIKELLGDAPPAAPARRTEPPAAKGPSKMPARPAAPPATPAPAKSAADPGRSSFQGSLLYTLARPGPALVGLAGILVAGGAASAQRPAQGDRALAAGDPAGAAAAFLVEAGRGTGRDTAFYNAGTAALEAGRLDVARGALAEAAKSLDPALRYRALYNLGLADLLAAQADSARGEEFLEDAVDRLRQALLLEPSSARAKWNLELADRRRPPPPSGGGGGAGGTPPPSGGGGREQPEQGETRREGLSQSQAEQILNSMERRERETRTEQQRRQQAGSAGGVKDW
jgi:hypothetical protein